MAASENQQESISTTEYEETAYADASYEVVGEPPAPEIFMPLTLQIVPTKNTLADPMFEDYGGHSTEGESERWHLPEGVRVDARRDREHEESVEVDTAAVRAAEIAAARAEGEAAGREQAAAETQAMIDQNNQQINQRMTSMFQDLVGQLREHVANHEKQAVSLALEISKKIIDEVVEINPEYVVKIVHEALSLTGGAQIRRVRVSKQDMEFIKVVGLQASLKEFDGTWDFEGDETINAGCVVETSAGEVDYQLDKAWERIREKVVKVIR